MAQNRLLSAKWLYWLVIGGLLAVLTLSAMLAPLAHATTINVTTLADELNQNGNCSLREAIRAANLDMSVDACPSGQGADSISLAPGIYRLGIDGRDEDAGTTGDLDVAADLMITGALSSTTVIDGGALDRVIDSLSGAHVAISNVTLQNGTPGLGADGGGVRNAGALTLVDTIVAGNSAEDFAGGGIHSSGVLTITGSIIRNNTAGNGGGINNEGVVHVLGSLVNQNTGGGIATAGAATVANTILSENVGASSGGGIANLQGTLIVASSAIISNTAEFGGGLRNSGTLSVTHTLIQGNSGEIGGGVTNESSVGASLSASTISGNVGSGIQN
ncbi:MAG TPA: CSLREA domain-containing protein, partial [Roseiflexaceae bacterium]|nr:CSLREA domain-containing protein [Roseiflexaceae bacterium]